jgi:hypothetical protein
MRGDRQIFLRPTRAAFFLASSGRGNNSSTIEVSRFRSYRNSGCDRNRHGPRSSLRRNPILFLAVPRTLFGSNAESSALPIDVRETVRRFTSHGQTLVPRGSRQDALAYQHKSQNGISIIRSPNVLKSAWYNVSSPHCPLNRREFIDRGERRQRPICNCTDFAIGRL